MAILTTTQLETHIETDLAVATLQRLLDDAEDAIVDYAGSATALIHEFINPGYVPRLFLRAKAASITTVVETVGTTETTLSSDDYVLRMNGRILERKNDGTNPRVLWGDIIKVTFAPVDDTSMREMVQVDLVKLAIAFDGSKRIGIGQGEFTADNSDYSERRQKILSRLATWL